MADGQTDAVAGIDKNANDIAKTGFLGYVFRHAQDMECENERFFPPF